MVKTLRIFCTLLLSLNLLFAAFEAEIANFDKNFASSNDKLKFHHQFTSLYIQSMVNGDDESKKELLKRLVISSKELNLDPTTYENELKALENKAVKPLFVLSSKQQEDSLTLNLSENLDSKNLRISALEEKDKNRYIIDFDASLDGGRKEFDFEGVRVLLAQFDKKTTRLVLQAKQKLEYNIVCKDKSLVLKLKIQTATSSQKPQATNAAKNSTQNSNSTKNSNAAQTSNQTSNSAKNSSTQKTNSTQTSATQKTSPAKKIYILKSSPIKNGVELNLSSELDEKNIKQIHMREKGIYRVVLSFEAALEGQRKNYSINNDTVILTQYSSKVVRVVFSSRDKFEVLKKSSGNKISFSFVKENSASTPSTSSTPKSSTNKASTKASKNTTQKTSQSINSKSKIIVIDAGHGGKDGGAVGNGGKWIEKNIVLQVALKTGEKLKKKGYKVFYTRTTDKFINLRDRTKIANDKKASLFISIHANAAINSTKAKTMQGIETFFLSPARSERSKEVAAQENQADLEEANYFLKQNFLSALSREKIIASNRLAIDVQKNVLNSVRSKYKVSDGGVREAPFWVLVGAQDMPAVLIEIGYISHLEEGKRLLNKAYQELLAQGMAEGIEAYFRNNADE